MKVTSKSGMSGAELSFHIFMLIGTCGFWYPVYKMRKFSADRKTVTEYTPDRFQPPVSRY